MDVADLAPALLALGELIKQTTFNGDAAKVNLIVQSDFEHKCFQINLELNSINTKFYRNPSYRRARPPECSDHR